MIICSACGQSFSVVGYMQHIYSTSHTACIKAYEWDLELANGKEAGDLYEDSYEDDYEDGGYEDLAYDAYEHEEGMSSLS